MMVIFITAGYSNDTVDGSEIRRSPVDMVNIPLFTGFIHVIHTRWFAGFLKHQQYVYRNG